MDQSHWLNSHVCVTEQQLCCVFCWQVYVLKRPHVDEFLQKMGELFECVLFTASLAKVRLSLTHIHTQAIINREHIQSDFFAVALCYVVLI